jgi:hypothetical protein
LFAWAWTLIRLYKDIKHSEKLLPNKRIFILHGSLLTGYLLLNALSQIIVHAYNHTDNIDANLILGGVFDILISISQFVEMMTFFLVVKLMLPITPLDKENRSKF